MTLKVDAKFGEKLTCSLENDMKNLTNFYQSTRKFRNRDFDGIILFKVENVLILNVTDELCVMTMKNDAKFEEELTYRFKIDMNILTNFDLITQKSEKLEL